MSNMWDSIQNLFEKALALPEEDRMDFVRAHAKEDSQMLTEVMSLLEAFSEDSDFLGGSAFEMIVPGTPEAGSMFGPYRILEKIGSGGMGSVYLAERADGTFEQRVALKVVKKGMDSGAVVARFRLERQVLARLIHPNIARLLDGGITNDGRPFFVMEHIEGTPITEYCDNKTLSVDQRLRLFKEVCNAVHHAHRNLVVHRDLKPSNILVTREGRVKLLDFGIAKVLSDEDGADITRTGQNILTPAYASPEQISSGAITTSSDVYSLGVILYELLAGRRPFEIRKSRRELEQQVLSVDPDRPSTAILQTLLPTDLDTAAVTPQTISESRGTRVEKLRRKLSGDLDKICLMALRKEAERRYPSAQDFAEDVQRHLEGLTVYAQPDSLSYRMQKFVTRHKVGVISALAGLAAFLTMIAFYTTRVANERDAALAEQAKTEEVVNFVTGLFEYADPDIAKGRDITVREILDLGAVDIGTQLNGQPQIQSTLQRVLGEVYYGIGDLYSADSLLRKSLTTTTGIEASRLSNATTQLALGIIHQDRGEVQQADSLYLTALDTREELLPTDHIDIAEALSLIGFLRETEGNYAAAESLFFEVLRINELATNGEVDRRVAESLVNLGGLYKQIDRSAEAEEYLLKALNAQLELYDGDHLEIAETKKDLAGVYRDSGRYEESESLYVEVIDVRTRMLGPEHSQVANTLNSYANLLSTMGRIEEAIHNYNEMIRIHRISFDGPHPSLAAAYNNLALMIRDSGDPDRAEEYFLSSISMQDSVGLPKDHPNRAYPLTGLATNYNMAGRYQDAIDILRSAFAIRRNALTSEHRHTMDTASDLGRNLTEVGQFQEAETLLLEAHSYFLENRGADDRRTVRASRRLATLYTEMGQDEKALKYQVDNN